MLGFRDCFGRIWKRTQSRKPFRLAHGSSTLSPHADAAFGSRRPAPRFRNNGQTIIFQKSGVRSRDSGAERLAVEISSVHTRQMKVIFEIVRLLEILKDIEEVSVSRRIPEDREQFRLRLPETVLLHLLRQSAHGCT